jgi:hypothetical protein
VLYVALIFAPWFVLAGIDALRQRPRQQEDYTTWLAGQHAASGYVERSPEWIAARLHALALEDRRRGR